MAKKTKPVKPTEPSGPPEFAPVAFETFLEPCAWTVSNLTQQEPSVFNGVVRARRYRITFERIEEPLEVIQARLLKLWREEDNMHQYGPLRQVGTQYGLDLPKLSQFGCDKPKKPKW